MWRGGWPRAGTPSSTRRPTSQACHALGTSSLTSPRMLPKFGRLRRRIRTRSQGARRRLRNAARGGQCCRGGVVRAACASDRACDGLARVGGRRRDAVSATPLRHRGRRDRPAFVPPPRSVRRCGTTCGGRSTAKSRPRSPSTSAGRRSVRHGWRRPYRYNGHGRSFGGRRADSAPRYPIRGQRHSQRLAVRYALDRGTIANSYDTAIHALTSAPDVAFEIPGDLGPNRPPVVDEPVLSGFGTARSPDIAMPRPVPTVPAAAQAPPSSTRTEPPPLSADTVPAEWNAAG